MQAIASALVIAAAIALVLWRGIALFNYGLRKKNL
jgi:hypothetical protein